MPQGRKTRIRVTRRAADTTQHALDLADCHELARETALQLAGGDKRRLQVLDERTIRVVNPA